MNQAEFFYHAIFRTEERIPPPTGMICSELTSGPPRTVLWDPVDRTWVFERKVGARYLFDDRLQEFRSPVSRAEAEHIAREHLGTELPTEQELHRICEEGEAALTQTE